MSRKIKITKILFKPCQNHLQICVQSLIVKMNYVSTAKTCLIGGINLKRLWMTCYCTPMFITAGLPSKEMRKGRKKNAKDVLMHKAIAKPGFQESYSKKLRWTQRLEPLMLKRVKNGSTLSLCFSHIY